MIIDAHQDIAYNAWALGRNFLLSAHETRAREAAANPQRAQDICTVGLPDMLAVGIGLAVGSIFVDPVADDSTPAAFIYATAKEANAQAQIQVAYYHQLAQDARVIAVRCRADLDRLHQARAAGPALGLLIDMEGSDPILSAGDVSVWWERGVRQVGLAWALGSRYCGGNRAPGPLKGEAKAVLRAMDDLGMILDVSHLSEQSFWQALDLFSGPLVASHSNCRTLVSGERQLSDDMIKAIAARRGVIGVVIYNTFLKEGWTREQGKDAVTLADVVRHIDHMTQLTGSAEVVGIGSDLDGGFGREAMPAEIDTVADLQRLGLILAVSGYTSSAVSGILGDNWLRFFRQALPAV